MRYAKSILACGRYSSWDVLQILPFLVTGRYIFLQILGLTLIVRTEIIPIDLSPLQIQIVSAGLNVEHRTVLFIKLSYQHIFV